MQDDERLWKAADAGNVTEVQELLASHSSLTWKDASSASALNRACYCGHEEVVRVLLEAGADKDDANSMGWTALINACRNGHTPIAKMLLERGANIDAVNAEGWTALICAAARGHTEAARLLLAAGAAKDLVDNDGYTALMCAVWQGHEAVVKLLLETGASRVVRDRSGKTVRDHAQENGHTHIIALLNRADGSERQKAEQALRQFTSGSAPYDAAALRAAISEAEGALVQTDLLRRARAMLQSGGELLPVMWQRERRWREGRATHFYFLRANEVRDCKIERLPRFQDIKATHPHWLQKLPIDMTSALTGEYTNIYVGISHRWEDPQQPDTLGRQLEAIKRYLHDNLEVEYVWFDFSSMPQAPRTDDENAEFKQMLDAVNMIYIGTRVLILVDLSCASVLSSPAFRREPGCSPGPPLVDQTLLPPDRAQM